MARFAKLQQAGKFDEIIAMIGTDAVQSLITKSGKS